MPSCDTPISLLSHMCSIYKKVFWSWKSWFQDFDGFTCFGPPWIQKSHFWNSVWVCVLMDVHLAGAWMAGLFIIIIIIIIHIQYHQLGWLCATSLLSQCDIILSAVLLTRTETSFNLFQLANPKMATLVALSWDNFYNYTTFLFKVCLCSFS
jgi:hypothetical protein